MNDNKTVSTKKCETTENNDDPNPRPKLTHSTSKKIWIEDGILFEEVTTRYYECWVVKDPETGKEESFRNLKKVKKALFKYVFSSVEKSDLKTLRKSGRPIFILKDGGKYFCTEIPFKMNLNSADLDVEHKCVPKGAICGRMSPLPDEMGGCAKLRDYYPHLERYDFITKAYETNNTRWEAFVVAECMNHEWVPDIDPMEKSKWNKQAKTTKKKDDSKKTKGNTEESVVETLRKMPMLFY